MSPDLSVIIVSWNVRDDLLRCLDALLSADVSSKLSLDIIVVDNASSDGTSEAVNNYPVTLIANNTNVGYGKANNQGFAVATGRHLLVLNPDTIPQLGSLDALISFLHSQPNAGMVSPRLLNRDGSIQTAAFAFPTLTMAFFDLFPLSAFVPGRIRRGLELSRLNGRYKQERLGNHPFRIDHPLGACIMLRREAYDQCGGFDAVIFMYSEEIDLALRYRAAGWECWQAPDACVVHLGGQSTRQMPDRMFVELWRSRLFIYSNYYAPQQERVLRLLLRLAMVRDIAAGRLARVSQGKRTEIISRARRARAVLTMLREKW